MGTVQEFFEGLPTRVTPDRIEGMNNTYVFDIEGAGVWTVADRRRRDHGHRRRS